MHDGSASTDSQIELGRHTLPEKQHQLTPVFEINGPGGSRRPPGFVLTQHSFDQSPRFLSTQAPPHQTGE